MMTKARVAHMKSDAIVNLARQAIRDVGGPGAVAYASLIRQWHVDDDANLVLFLASDNSAFISGANIDINGGILFL